MLNPFGNNTGKPELEQTLQIGQGVGRRSGCAFIAILSCDGRNELKGRCRTATNAGRDSQFVIKACRAKKLQFECHNRRQKPLGDQLSSIQTVLSGQGVASDFHPDKIMPMPGNLVSIYFVETNFNFGFVIFQSELFSLSIQRFNFFKVSPTPISTNLATPFSRNAIQLFSQ